MFLIKVRVNQSDKSGWGPGSSGCVRQLRRKMGAGIPGYSAGRGVSNARLASVVTCANLDRGLTLPPHSLPKLLKFFVHLWPHTGFKAP